ncbi:hypothetical protein Tco_0052496 [Tanacetum coccineum]
MIDNTNIYLSSSNSKNHLEVFKSQQQQPMKPKIKDTQVPQSSDPIENVVDEVVHKELGNSLVRAATTASSLEAEQDSVPRNHGDAIAQTRFESVSKHSNDSLLARGNTLQSDEDILKLDELMALCTTLQNQVLDLEKTKTTQHNEIASLKRRVKKLEKKDRSRTHRPKRLYKVGLTARVESSDNEKSLGEDASKQGRIDAIDAIDADEEITWDIDSDLVKTLVMNKKRSIRLDEERAKIDADHQLAERMQAQEQEELSIEEKATLFQQLLEKKRKHFAAKSTKEKRNKPPTKAQ